MTLPGLWGLPRASKRCFFPQWALWRAIHEFSTQNWKKSKQDLKEVQVGCAGREWHHQIKIKAFYLQAGPLRCGVSESSEIRQNFLIETGWNFTLWGWSVLPLFMKGRKNWERTHQWWTIPEPQAVNFLRMFCINIRLRQKNKTDGCSGKRPGESWLKETLLKTKYGGKLVEINAEEKKSVETWGYYLGREDTRGRK